MKRNLLFLTAALLLLTVGWSVQAQDMSPMAEGFDNPRGMFMMDGTLYLADAGRGGEVTATGIFGDGQAGGTSTVYAIAEDGSISTVAYGLPSFSAMGEVVGASDVHMAGGLLWIATGQGPRVNSGNPNNPLAYGVLAVDPVTLRMSEFIDFYAYEAENNPAGDTVPDGDQPMIDSNVVGLDTAADGTLYVADAGANTVYSWTPDGGIQVLRAYSDNPVPTDVSVGPDGDIYISFLTGFPFAEGSAFVERVSADGELVETYEGFTTLVHVMATADGVYVVDFGGFSPDAGWTPNNGSIERINADGSTETLVSGLNFPYGLEMTGAGDLIVTVNSAYGEPGSGQVMVIGGSMDSGESMDEDTAAEPVPEATESTGD